MTTEVIIKANHGWPVDVTYIGVRENGFDGAHPIAPRIVRIKPGDVLHTCVHSGQDLRITEVQPTEITDGDQQA
jgi:hypothetical protein